MAPSSIKNVTFDIRELFEFLYMKTFLQMVISIRKLHNFIQFHFFKTFLFVSSQTRSWELQPALASAPPAERGPASGPAAVTFTTPALRSSPWGAGEQSQEAKLHSLKGFHPVPPSPSIHSPPLTFSAQRSS